MVDVAAIMAVVTGAREVIGFFREARDLLPEGEDREKIDKAIEDSERKMQIADAEIAKGFGYELCQCDWPPTIMTTVEADHRTKVFQCPKCDNKIRRTSGGDMGKIYPRGRS